jgi:hypothetical protein
MRAFGRKRRDGPRCPSLSRFYRFVRLGAIPIALAGSTRPLDAQLFARPWLDWHTIHAGRFDVHYPSSLAAWARFVAERLPAVDSAVTTLVGYTPGTRVQIVVEDPFGISNGFAFTLIDRPAIVFWASPPDPRESIGQFRTWGEMLAAHEYGHVAHLTRPSRNPLERFFWRLAPVDLGPIALRSPRWVVEGYATYIEGRVTGTGRPHGVWRPATLRQWAIEGRLPTYGQLSSWSDFSGGEFAYLAGSAFLEWLAERHGDSSIVDVWRRLTARSRRSFDDAFSGVYGDPPAIVYDRFRAEVTAEAVGLDSAMSHRTVEGDLVQHLARGTGDPAISKDGTHVAVVLRSASRPSRVVVWNTAPQPDTLDRRGRERLLEKDPEDVPSRPVYPRPKRAIATLVARDGRSFEDPRWMPDGRHILLWRPTRRADGSLRPELYSWEYARHSVRRLTRQASVRNADPAPDGQRAVGLRCPGGHCDVVTVDLQSGAVQLVASGDVLTTYARPRWSPDGHTIAVAQQRENRWRIALLDDRGASSPRFVDPDDGASRFDPSWLNATTLVVVSDRAGAPDLERIDVGGGAAASGALTRVTGAAVAPEPNAADGSIWFLSLYSRGYDVRRLRAATAIIDSAASPLLDPRLGPVAMAPPTMVRAFAPSPTVGTDYGTGTRTTRWLPAASVSTAGREATFALVNTDAVGRLTLLGQLALGSGDVWRGAAVDAAWRFWRPTLSAALFDASVSYPLIDIAPVLFFHRDRSIGARVRGDLSHAFDRSELRAGLGGTTSRLDEQINNTAFQSSRELGFAEARWGTGRSGDQGSVSGVLSANLSAGRMADTSFQRLLAAIRVRAYARGFSPVELNASYGQLSRGAPLFERFTIGGPPLTLLDPSLYTQRVSMAAMPTGVVTGERVLIYRLATSLLGLSPFYWAGSAHDGSGGFRDWHRVVGAEILIDQSELPVLGLPGARLLSGVGYSLDSPFAHETRAYLSITLRP